MPLVTVDSDGKDWDEIITKKIKKLSERYSNDAAANSILAKWHHDITLGNRRAKDYSPHVNGFYMIFMVHGTWYDNYKVYINPVGDDNDAGLSGSPYFGSHLNGNLDPSTKNNSFNMLATDIDVPDITEEYTAISSRLRNSFVPSRNYFVSDFSISYIENVNMEVIRYHEAWHKYLELLKRGEIDMYSGSSCKAASEGEFLDMPFTNAVWVAVFKPFTTDIQLLIKLMGVMPVTMPLKQVVGNRSSSKMTVLNLQYKAADIFYKFYNGTSDFIQDKGILAESFRHEIIDK